MSWGEEEGRSYEQTPKERGRHKGLDIMDIKKGDKSLASEK